MIDTLKYSRQLEEADFTPKQSELLVRSQIAMITDNVATRMDIKELSHRIEVLTEKTDARFETMETRFEAIENKLQAKFETIESRFEAMDAKTESLKSYFAAEITKVTNRLGVIIVLTTSTISALIHLF